MKMYEVFECGVIVGYVMADSIEDAKGKFDVNFDEDYSAREITDYERISSITAYKNTQKKLQIFIDQLNS